MSGPSGTAPKSEPIAVIGLGLRLPGAESLDQLWEHLAAGRSLITEVSPRRWDPNTLKESWGQAKRTTGIWGGFIEDADCFDAAFFNISPREASWMDPQQRFALELAWKAIEDAGIRASSLAGSRTGVYMGVCHWDYAELIEKNLTYLDAYTPTGIAFSIIANRVSHFFDFRGPSITSDTACAASMTSVYEACRALAGGECDLALAGGVNLCWSPNHFIAFSKNGMLSKDGRSKAFDSRADGYVRGEGGAVLLLKPLQQARADGDPIHAIIRGIGTNHGGRTNSLTATNPTAQAALIAGIYRDAGVTPDTVSYIEAHGTGTPLGDPIEIAGLKEAFRTLAAETGAELRPRSCGIGSVKTNIGHLEGAAGVAGIVKVIAAIHHETLPPNVDFIELNSLIDLASTPFRIQTESTAWPRDVTQPRRAGVSSFGFGGSNAHVLLEDDAQALVQSHRDRPDAGRLFVVPLSAKNHERLRAYAAELLRFFQVPRHDQSLQDLAYTLQTGREAMPSRVAFVVENQSSLQSALQAFLADLPDPQICLPRTSRDGEDLGEPWQTAHNWINGGDVEWARFYVGTSVQRIHAPTYPFGRERYWMDESLGGKDADGVCHPLLHRNTSRFGNQCYRSRFKGSEFFWLDHHVHGAQVLPGTVYLEMARAAYAQATGSVANSAISARFENMIWTRPIRASTAPVLVEISLSGQRQDHADFTIASSDLANGVNAKGTIGAPAHDESPATRDIAALLNAASGVIDADRCYERLRASGVVHGPAFRAITEVHRGADFVLANLKLPRLVHNTLESLALHPIMLDAAIQAWVGLIDDAPAGAAVPFACRQINVTGRCESAMWAYVRPAEPIRRGSSVASLNVDLCDRQGQVRVALRELVLRMVTSGAEADVAAATDHEVVPAAEPTDLVYAEGRWCACPVNFDPNCGDWDTAVFLAGISPDLAAELAARTGVVVSLLAPPDERDPAATTGSWFCGLHSALSDQIRAKPRRRQQILVLSRDSGPADTPIAALLRTAQAEQPKIFGAVIRIEGPINLDRLVRIVTTERTRSDRFSELRYDADDVRMAWRPVAIGAPVSTSPPAVAAHGVYWITGGAGGLGLIFARALVARGATKIVLSGRRTDLDAAASDAMATLRANGCDVRYAPCDVSCLQDVTCLVAWIERDLGCLKGVIHGAGVLDDGYIFGTDPDRIDPVLAPKVAGTLNIDTATQDLPLDFFVLCSSVAAVFGNPGQATYAGANAFMDAFAEHRAVCVARGRRRGATLSIAWPLWEAGGMAVDAVHQAALRSRFGTDPLPTEIGTAALGRMLDARCSGRWTVLHGEMDSIKGLLRDFGAVAKSIDTPMVQREALNSDDLVARTVSYLKDLLAELIQTDPTHIRTNRPLAEYGLDSIVIVELTARLERGLGPISKTMFFEHVDLGSVAAYLVEEHRGSLATVLAADVSLVPNSSISGPVPASSRHLASDQVQSSGINVAKRSRSAQDANGRHDIAIVGLSLRVAKARDKAAFWEMLANGVDAFEPYPPSRWNHAALLHPERDVLGKTVVQTGAFLDGIDEFDPRYFHISQYEAELMSPEVRLFLQASVEAFEDAGYSREYLQRRFKGDVAVIVGSMTNEYDLYGFQNMLMRGALASGSYTGTIPNMVSYFYGFTGPSYFLDTMCSASSTCVHEAVHMLRAGRCKMALAGGVSLLLHPQKLIATSQEQFTTKTAKVIHGYGLGADGTILGEGVGALVLKTLADAERDGDHIYGVITGTGISNAGIRNGFTVPNPLQQAVAIEQALEDAGIDPRTISYVEGHGSGTALGDPIEVKALTLAYRKYTRDNQFCAIGTVKSNIAHLLGASGIAGIAKVLMQLARGQLAPSLHAEPLNPNIPFVTTPFYVQRALGPWPRLRDRAGRELPRRAAITSIGAGGMNSHIIIEEHAPTDESAASPPREAELFVFSAVNEGALLAWLTRVRSYLIETPTVDLADLAYTLQVGRNELPCRLACVCSDHEHLLRVLSAFIAAPGAMTDAFYTRSILDSDPNFDVAQVAADTKRRFHTRLAAYWAAGTAIDWDEMRVGRRRRLSLPAYPFERVRCWYPEYADAPSVVQPMGARSKLHPFIGVNRSDLSGLRYSTPIHLGELLDYVYIENKVQSVLPTAIVEIAAALGQIAGLGDAVALRDLQVMRAIEWRDVTELECVAERSERHAGGLRVVINTIDAAGNSLPYASAWALVDDLASPSLSMSLDNLRRQAVHVIDDRAFYETLGSAGLRFKPYLEVVKQAYLQPDGSILCEVDTSPSQQDQFKRNVRFPPRLLGAAFQALVLKKTDPATLRLAAVATVRLTKGEATSVLVRPTNRNGRFDVLFLDRGGSQIAAFHSVALQLAAALPSVSASLLSHQQFVGQTSEPAAAPPVGAASGRSHRQLCDELLVIAGGLLKFSPQSMSARATFYDLGFDSISLTRFASAIGDSYGTTVSPAIFFQYENIEALCSYLIDLKKVRPSESGRAATADPSLAGVPGVPAAAAAPIIRNGPVVAVGPSAVDQRIAIIGLAARLPGSDSAEMFIDHLLAGRDLITDFPLDRYGETYRASIMRAGFVKRGGFLEDIDRFDAAYFKTTPVEAERIDPQQRLMLETVWRALEDAGYRPEELPANTGVFVGVTGHEYATLLQVHGVAHDGFVATGNSLAMVANRISYQLDVHGPSESVDTACSSSLVALLRAAEAIRSGACEAAVVGGVNLTLAIEGFEGPYQAGMLSSDGRCKTFSRLADGYVRGEGVVAMLLKPLLQAERDGDAIRGILIGGAENHGGRAGSLTAPNAKAQADLVIRAMAGIDPASIGYIEAHGTGTSLGDPVEISGLRLAYEALMSEAESARPSIGIGSVKSNIGHLEAAAGLAGVVKVLMSMRRGELPASLHCDDVNPHIDLGDSPFYLVRRRRAWPRPRDRNGREMPRRAGVSSFGFGGSNAHVVLEEHLLGGGAPRRQPLPARTFADTRYWIPGVRHTKQANSTAAQVEIVLLTPTWVLASLPTSGSEHAVLKKNIVVSCGVAVSSRPSESQFRRIVNLEAPVDDVAMQYRLAAGQLLDTLQQEIRSADEGTILVQLAIPLGDEGEIFEGLGAMLDSVSAEDPRLVGQVIGFSPNLAAADVAQILAEEARVPTDRRVRYQEGRRFTRAWCDLPRPLPADRSSQPRWRDGGIYLMTGGMGALGRLIARDIAARAASPVLILIGSSRLDADRAAFLDKLTGLGARPYYRQADVADADDVNAVVREAVDQHGALHGVFHCAGIIRDSYVLNKSRQDLNAVLAPKVSGAVNLARACRSQKLDFLAFFSSLAGAVGNAGQADYAAANGFLDVFATRHDGRAVSINWPLWRDGGMRVDAATEAAFFEQMGQRPLSAESGLSALATALASGARQMAVVAGAPETIRAFFAQAPRNRELPAELASPDPLQVGSQDESEGELIDRTVEALRRMFARISGVSAERIEAHTSLDEYGIDSLMITRMNRELGDVFGTISKTLLFEHRSLDGLARHLALTYVEPCRRWVAPSGLSQSKKLQVPAALKSCYVTSPPSISSARATIEPIAIIGLSGRYPAAPNLDRYWTNLLAGLDAISEVPAERWSLAGFFHSDPSEAVAKGMSYSKWGGFLEGFADFDPLFFKISPREAAAMDPQERLFLMAAWSAVEGAGYTRRRLAERHGSRVGVFTGITKTGFALHGAFRVAGGGFVRPTTSFSSAANRVSHLLDLCGPSMPVDTMCSSSLTAIHEACEHLRSGDCEMALAGGVNLYLHPSTYVELSASRMLSRDGRCKSFGKGGDGFVPGEGVGCVVLKPLSRALADGDHIHALIRSSAVNHGGRTNGFTVPNPVAQRDLIRAALDRAGVAARDVTCVEAHGTGTELGDPIEVAGLIKAFRADTLDTAFCALGSVKSSIGHLEAAAGIAGLTKVILQMRYGILVPTLHAEELNPNIDLTDSPFVLTREPTAWRAPRRIAGVSSFGAGGANAHVILEAWPSPGFSESSGAGRRTRGTAVIDTAASPVVAIPLSARDPERLMEYAVSLLSFVEPQCPGPARSIDPAGLEVKDIEDLVVAKIADLLDVAPSQIDRDEPFDAIGISPLHRLGLRDWAETAFGIELTVAALQPLGSIPEFVAMLAPLAAAAGTHRHGSAPHVIANETFELGDLAFTLQVGREAMDARLAVEASSFESLAGALRAYVDGKHDHPGLYVGRAQDHHDLVSTLADDLDDLRILTKRWMERGSLGRLLGLWVKGWPVQWDDLPRLTPSRIVPLPTYPFASERYWIPGASAARNDEVIADLIEDVPGGGDQLWNQADDLERALVPLVRSIIASVPSAKIVPQFARWRQALDALLARFLPAEDDAAGADPWSGWEDFKFRSGRGGEPSSQVVLAETMLRALPAILTGAQAAPAIMFPAGSVHLVDGVYRRNPIADRFNEVLAAAAAAEVGQRLSRQPKLSLRILEIGAGTGGTSEAVFRALAPYQSAIAEYRFTDVSRAFLIRAERQFRIVAPYLATSMFDVEKPLASQDIAPGCYDLVIAANVLHATADIRHSLSVVRDSMARDGLLLINETSKATLFTHVTFGLLSGWWRFVDGDVRIPGTPALTSKSWRTVLEATGLRWIAGSVAAEQRLGQQVIAAVAEPRGTRSESVEPAEPVIKPEQQSVAEVGSNLRLILRQAVAETLTIAPSTVGIDDAFADYGLDSILGAELIAKLRQVLGVEIEHTRLFDFSTVARLEAFIADRFPDAVATLARRAASEELRSTPPATVAEDVSAATISLPTPSPPAHPQVANAKRSREPIAIVGMSGRFAKSSNVDELWAHLIAGRDLVEPVTRFAIDALYKEAEPGSYGRHGSFIDGTDCFDSVFFGISGVEARYMDPQQRLFLEEAWKTLEHAGHAGADIEGRRCGVFVGCSSGDYQELFKTQPPGQAFWGNTSSLVPARIAYCLDLKGPAIAVDTACSSSLVALHLACQSLWNGETDFALAGGVFIQSTNRFYRYANQARMLSPSGRCAAFGEGADGIVPGEAVAAVLLRPLSEALADGDTIHGLVVATGTNQDGTTNGITAPSAISQERLIRTVYDEFAIDPATVGLVEAHGTGTVLGDPIEHDALAGAFAAYTDRRGFCALGSIKSNIGHATTAAGIAGLIKVLLALRHRAIPPNLHVGRGNPKIRLADGPFYINRETQPWPTIGHPRRAAISSFGFSGTNAHVVIEEAVEQPTLPGNAPAYLVVLSARSKAQLRLQAERLVACISERPDLDCADVAYTLLVGRRHHHHRLAAVARDLKDLSVLLQTWSDDGCAAGIFSGELDDKERPNDAARITAGNALIQRMRDGDLPQTPAAVPERNSGYVAALGEVAQAFVSGDALRFDALFDPTVRRRLPLPTYPFAAIRHWVDPPDAAGPLQSAAEVEAAPVAPSLPGAAVRLVDPASVSISRSTSATTGGARVALAPLATRWSGQARASAAAATSGLRRRPDAHGIRWIEMLMPWSPEVDDALVGELAAAAVDQSVCVVLVSGTSSWNGDASRLGPPAAAAAAKAAVACALPVVAAVAGSAAGDALIFALHCDFAVLAEDGCYAANAELPAEHLPLLSARLGEALARDMLVEGHERRGSTLRHDGLTLPIVPVAQVEAVATNLARSIAEAPRAALRELKRHLRQDPLIGRASPAGGVLRAQAERATASVSADQAGQPVALASEVIAIEVFPDGVALIRMRDRRSKNSFTGAFMAGMIEAFDIIQRSSAIKAVVLTGYDGYFACGGTRQGLESLQRGETSFTDKKIYSLPLSCNVPVIAAMQGHAIGAGWSLGLFCDLAVFSDDSVYHNNYLRLGFTPGAGATLVAPHRLGDDLGRETLFTAREYKGRDLAARAPELNVVPAAEVLDCAMTMARRLVLLTRQELIDAKAQWTRHLVERLEPTFARELAMHRVTLVGNPAVAERLREAFPSPSGTEETAASTTIAGGAAQSQQRGQIRRDLTASLAEELAINADEIRDTSRFIDLGLDSIMAVTWARRLNELFRISLPATTVYAYPTVGSLADRIATLVVPASAATIASYAAATSSSAEPRYDPKAAQREHLRCELVDSLADELMIRPDDIRDACGFLELGLDSILAVTWIRRLNQRLNVNLPATAVWAHPTVGRLLDRVVELAPDIVASTDSRTAEAPEGGELSVAPTPSVLARATPHIGSASDEKRHEPGRSSEASVDRHAIAVIGAAGRFPKAPDLDAFWDNIRTGRDCVTEVPPARWDVTAHFDPDPLKPGKSYCKRMGVVDGVDLFDPNFFNITPREAELMDPQQRLFLQCAWHAIEDAAIDPVRLAGSQCGVFVGSGPSGYADLIDERNAYSLLGSSGSILAARIAYLLDLRGPAISLDTACSSSLVAIAEACDSLLLGNSDLAIAGGASILIGPSMFIDTSKVSMLSKDGRCFTFDQRANGFVPGEGVGVLLLKRLADAERDGDPIRAVIRGWGVNQDGKTNGITAPNPQAQTRLLRGIYERFGIDCATIELIEAHGTGTPLGDPIEVEGLTGAFTGHDMRRAACALGSVKSNVGHLLAAAGIAGAMKAMLALERGEIPPTINFERQNEHIVLSDTPFYINTVLKRWPVPPAAPRRAAVSAFGFSGTNAHLVLEEYRPPARNQPVGSGPWVIPLSARNPEQLAEYANVLARFVAARPDLDPADLAATFQSGRTPFGHRLAFIVRNRRDMITALEAIVAGRAASGIYRSGPIRSGTAGQTGASLAPGELAQQWAHGADVVWPITASLGRRIQAPGYPFAGQRCWIEPAGSDICRQEAMLNSAARDATRGDHPPRRFIDVVTSCSDGDAITATFRGNGGHLSNLVTADDHISVGLFLPEMAYAAAQLATKHSVQGLKQLVWGKPVQINGQMPKVSVVFRSDEHGVLYDVLLDGDDVEPCHVGALILGEESNTWPEDLAIEEFCTRHGIEDVTDAWLRFAGLGDRLRPQDSSRAEIDAAIRQVYRTHDEVAARLRFPHGTMTKRGLSIDPLYLQALWRLMAFQRAIEYAGEARFPYALERLLCAEALPDEMFLRLWRPRNDRLSREPAKAVFYDVNGRPRLMLDGLQTRPLDELPELGLVGT